MDELTNEEKLELQRRLQRLAPETVAALMEDAIIAGRGSVPFLADSGRSARDMRALLAMSEDDIVNLTMGSEDGSMWRAMLAMLREKETKH